MRNKDINKLDNIQKAVIKIVNQEGLGSATMKKIAKEAGVSVGTPYVYFKNQEDMINQVFINLEKEFSGYIYTIFDSKLEVKENCRNIWFGIIQYSLENKDKFKFIEHIKKNPIINDISREEIHTYFDFLSIFVANAQEKNLLIKAPLSLIASIFFMSSFNIIDCPVIDKDTNPMNEEDYYELAFNMAWNSIKA